MRPLYEIVIQFSPPSRSSTIETDSEDMISRSNSSGYEIRNEGEKKRRTISAFPLSHLGFLDVRDGMSSGRISIGTRPRAVSTSRTMVAGSLDIVASFLRASTFLEEQLVVSPSLTPRAHYLDEEALDSTTSREESISDQHTPSRDWSEDDSSDTEHHLPPNAIAIRRPQLLQQTSSSLSSELPQSILAQPRPQSTPAHSIHLPETTPLLSPSFQPDSLNPRHSHSRRPRYPGLRQRRSDTSLHCGESLFSRRFSIVSTNLQEAIVEKRGHSTKFQTLFNLINCLIGIGLLAMPYVLASLQRSISLDTHSRSFPVSHSPTQDGLEGRFFSPLHLSSHSVSISHPSPSHQQLTRFVPSFQTPPKFSPRSWPRTPHSKRTQKYSSVLSVLKHGLSFTSCSLWNYRAFPHPVSSTAIDHSRDADH